VGRAGPSRTVGIQECSLRNVYTANKSLYRLPLPRSGFGTPPTFVDVRSRSLNPRRSRRDAPYLPHLYQGIIDTCRKKWSSSFVAVHLISVVDDDESVREALFGLLRSLGFAVSAFASAEEFLASDQLASADCLILDVRMPGMGGIELQRQLVAGHYEIPVIFITAHEEDGMRARALSDGVGAVLIKPFSEEAILSAIHSALTAQ
jgi:CheY-like chemotaxis protein